MIEWNTESTEPCVYGTRPRHGGVGGIDGGGGGGEFEEQGKVDSVMVQVSEGRA